MNYNVKRINSYSAALLTTAFMAVSQSGLAESYLDSDDSFGLAMPSLAPEKTEIMIEFEKDAERPFDYATGSPIMPRVEMTHHISADQTLFGGLNSVMDHDDEDSNQYGIKITYLYLKKQVTPELAVEFGKFRSLRGIFRKYEINDSESLLASKTSFNSIALRGQTGIRVKIENQINKNVRADYFVSATRVIPFLNDTIIGKYIKSQRKDQSDTNRPTFIGAAYLTGETQDENIQIGIEAATVAPGENNDTTERSVGLHGIYKRKLNDDGAYLAAIGEVVHKRSALGESKHQATVYSAYSYVSYPVTEKLSVHAGVFTGQDNYKQKNIGFETGLNATVYEGHGTKLNVFTGAAISKQDNGERLNEYTLGAQYTINF